MGSPVRGLRPMLAARRVTWKVPKPTKRTSFPFLSEAVMESKTPSRALLASALERPAALATAAIRSFLFTGGTPFAEVTELSPRDGVGRTTRRRESIQRRAG